MVQDELIEIQNKNTHNFVKLLKKPTGKVPVGFTFINILFFYKLNF